VIELRSDEVAKHIGPCDMRQTRDGLPFLLVPCCRCKIVGSTPDGPWEVYLCGRHQNLEESIPRERETSRWRDEFLNELGLQRDLAQVVFSGWTATAYWNDKQHRSLAHPIPTLKSIPTRSAAGTLPE